MNKILLSAIYKDMEAIYLTNKLGVMIESLILLEAKSSLPPEALMISLGNAKQIVVGSVPDFGTILHVAAESVDYLREALLEFSKIENVMSVITLFIRQQ